MNRLVKNIFLVVFSMLFCTSVFAIDDIVLYDESGEVFFSISDNVMYGHSKDLVIGQISDNMIKNPVVEGYITLSETIDTIEVISFDESNAITGRGCFYKSSGKMFSYSDHLGNKICYDYDLVSGVLIREHIADVISNIDEIYEYDSATGKKTSCTYVKNNDAITFPYMQFTNGNFFIDGSHMLKVDMCDYSTLAFYAKGDNSNYVLWNDEYSACITPFEINENDDEFSFIKYISDSNIHIESEYNTLVFYSGIEDVFYCFELVNDLIELDSCYQIKLIQNRVANYTGDRG